MTSIWSKTLEIPGRELLRGEHKTQAAVIGAGMAGILIASTLKEAGIKVTVLDARGIAGGQSCNTTAKITSQHNLVYRQLIETVGRKKAGQYAEANQAAVEDYKKLIKDRGIDCDLEELSAYVYSDSPEVLEGELAAARTLGLPAGIASSCKLPVPAAGALEFYRQAQFHPLKFIAELSRELEIYEHSPVREIEGKCLITPQGRLEAEKIIFACHFPFINFPGLYFARMYQERSYILALEGAPQVKGMWIGAGEKSYSLRNYKDLLLLGGEKHRAGENKEGGRYERLLKKAEEWFPGSREVARWSAQDCITPDGIPYIGRFSGDRPDWYVATGFNKWGMSSSMVAARLIRDLVLEKENPWAQVFDPGCIDLDTVAGRLPREGRR